MYARVTRIEGPPERVDDAIRVMQDLIPRVKEFSGFAGGYWMVDRATGRGQAVTLWDTREALEATEEAARQIRTGAAEEVGATIPSVEVYEVVAQA